MLERVGTPVVVNPDARLAARSRAGAAGRIAVDWVLAALSNEDPAIGSP